MIILIRKKIIFKYGIYREIKKFNPDIIHCVEQTPASTFCGAIAKTLNIPIVWSSHTNLDYYIPLYISKFFSPLSLRVYQMLLCSTTKTKRHQIKYTRVEDGR
jgi:hypothetical protein